ncbi:MAG TPA: DUF5916 domain-containing protein [Longimicrobiaceae bacterium]|nr:DUF5916 domain-containing protein [Longimicrobiaceae bacterium]
MLAALLLSAAVTAQALQGPTAQQSTPPGGGGALGLNAYRLTPAVGAPVLDGKLDDAVWTAADSIHSFIQRDPDEGKPARFPTVARVAFDETAVYVAVRAWDPEPDKLVAQLTRRDEDSSSDWLLVAFDSRHDQRTGYCFMVNPAGVKRDFLIADGANDDYSWDAVWEVAVNRDAQGWTAEFRIPLSALRFAPSGDGVWGFDVARVVPRVNEQSFWAPLKHDESRVVSRFGELRGMRGLPSPRRLEVLPYTVSGLTRAPGAADDPFHRATAWRGSAGVDIKYGVTSDLTLDATVNPDFGQVEADPSQVNLTQYETFLAEKRPFFTEGADIFRFGIALGDGDNATESLFYSRRIGRTPHYGMDGRFVRQPTQTTILGAGKLSGRVGQGWSVGALGAVTNEESGQGIDGDGTRFRQVVEPMTGYGVLRARRELNGGRTQLGFVGTGVHRRLGSTGIEDLPSDAFAGGVDFSHRWGGDAWLANGYLLGSTVHGDSAAILALQTSPARYFQRPDADYVRLDSSATALDGWASGYMLARVKGRWQGGVLGIARSPGFEVNDIGYLRQADQITNAAYLQYRAFNPEGIFRNYRIGSNLWDGRDFGWRSTSLGGNVNLNAQFLSYWGVYGGVERGLGALNTGSLRGGPAIQGTSYTSTWGGVYSDSRKPLSGELSFHANREGETGATSWGSSIYLAWRPTPSATLSLSPFYNRDRSGWQFVGRPDDAAGVTHYVYGDLDQQTVGMSVRVSQTFTPTLSLQLYAQPFISAGSYNGYLEVADPRAKRFADRFQPLDAQRDADGDFTANGVSWSDPNFDYRAFNLNAVLRWEYRLGSTMYFAWSHSRDGAIDDGNFRLWHDTNALFGYKPTNVFLIKVNWWVSL